MMNKKSVYTSIFDDTTFDSLLKDNRKYIKNHCNFTSLGSDILSVLFKIIGINCSGKYILDVGARGIISNSTNTSPLLMAYDLNGIFIESDGDKCKGIVEQSKKLGIEDKTTVIHAHLCWDGQVIKYRLGNILMSLDYALSSHGVNYKDIICVDFDIDGGEIYLWKDSKKLSECRPPLVMIEHKKYLLNVHVDGRRNKRFEMREKGQDDFLYVMHHANEMGYKPICSWSYNLFFVAKEYWNNITIPVTKSSSDLIQQCMGFHEGLLKRNKEYVDNLVDCSGSR